jgi:hypothetical protein
VPSSPVFRLISRFLFFSFLKLCLIRLATDTRPLVRTSLFPLFRLASLKHEACKPAWKHHRARPLAAGVSRWIPGPSPPSGHAAEHPILLLGKMTLLLRVIVLQCTDQNHVSNCALNATKLQIFSQYATPLVMIVSYIYIYTQIKSCKIR